MLKKCILYLFVLVGPGTNHLWGQVPFLDSTYIWTERLFFGSISGPTQSSTTRYTFDSSPTLINGNIYYEKLMSSAPSGNNWGHSNLFYRIDGSGKVYLSDQGNEILIYDYSLQLNDSFHIQNGFDTYLVVDKIDSLVLENGEKRKQLAMRCSFDEDPNNGWGYDYWIEGLGSTYGVYENSPGECLFDGEVPIMLCLSRNDTLLYKNMNYDSCWYIPTATKDIQQDQVSIYPNPASTEISIDAKDYIIQEVSIINLLGNVTKARNYSPVDISFFPPGYYLLRIKLENDQLIMKSFVKQ